jgi:hypothetical protein
MALDCPGLGPTATADGFIRKCPGGLLQLVATCAYDYRVTLTDRVDEAMAANTRDSMRHWFVDREDGFPTREMVSSMQASMFDPRRHPQPRRQPSARDPRASFSVKTERAAVHIQRAWRTALDNPRFTLCRDRLTREYQNLIAA